MDVWYGDWQRNSSPQQPFFSLSMVDVIICSCQQLLMRDVFQTRCPIEKKWSQNLYSEFWSDDSNDNAGKTQKADC